MPVTSEEPVVIPAATITQTVLDTWWLTQFRISATHPALAVSAYCEATKYGVTSQGMPKMEGDDGTLAVSRSIQIDSLFALAMSDPEIYQQIDAITSKVMQIARAKQAYVHTKQAALEANSTEEAAVAAAEAAAIEVWSPILSHLDLIHVNGDVS